LVFVEVVMNAILKGFGLMGNQKLAWANVRKDYSDWHEFRIFWDGPRNWNEICSWAVEQFGPPGDRYRTYSNFDSMGFLFRDSQDYVMFALRWA
jgi:hypothetical protein